MSRLKPRISINILTVTLLVATFLIPLISAYVEKPGPKIVPTLGHPWPLPTAWTQSDTLYSFNGEQFTFRVVDNTCDILENAIGRYESIIEQIKRNNKRLYRKKFNRRQENVGNEVRKIPR